MGFVAGLVVGAIPAAFALVVVGSLLRGPVPVVLRFVVASVIVAALLLRELGIARFPVPQNARLVPQFVTRVPFWGAVQFGAEMGTGMRTFSPTGLPHVIAVAVLLFASWPEAILAGAGFAGGRALMVLTFLAARDKVAADAAFVSALPRLRPVFAGLMIPVLVAAVAG